VLSGIGFITGALGVSTGVGILASGHAGVDGVEWLIGVGIDPYLTFESVPVTPLVVSVAALTACVATLALGAFAEP